ncbi:15998_t:CDS:2 [Funneliformis geosporum]|uniref:15998_t:CDS:1 n=1 Tax=Funneliformis geosporum TaxID=1117311 RepID=A0A9W4STQ4_9GLOM|nr:15998_t:CDS:2 [Funneliformis geosporum]
MTWKRAIESRIIDLTNWSSVEWSQILKTEDKAKLFRTCQQKLLKDQIDKNVICLIDNTSLRNLNDLKQLKDKLSNIRSEDGNLLAEIISFLIEKESKAVKTRKRRKIHAEYVKFGNESTKLDVIIELRNYGIELVTAEVGITQKDYDDLKFREDHTALKIELKDMIDNFYDVLHFKKKDLAKIFVMGIQATGQKWTIYCLSYNYDVNFYFLSEVTMLIIPKTMSAVESLLGPFIKNLLRFRHTLLMLNTKITIARQSTPLHLRHLHIKPLKPQILTE